MPGTTHADMHRDLPACSSLRGHPCRTMWQGIPGSQGCGKNPHKRSSRSAKVGQHEKGWLGSSMDLIRCIHHRTGERGP